MFGIMLGKKSLVGLCIIFLGYLINNYYNNIKLPSPIVQIQNGKLQGIISLTRNGREYYSYMGIPYGKPPIGQLRFEPPKPFDTNWEGIRDASTFGSICLQIELFSQKIGGSEDCLFLNVYQPKIENLKHLLPVMVFIHGGAFIGGSSNRYSGKYFMDEDIILVTINYRVGALGFLNTGDKNIRGNMGLKDQVEALKWIKQNIINFNGDPNSITIFGNSAGGSSVHYHILSPLSKGLFHRAISQSGTAISHWALMKTPLEQSQRFAKLLNCPTLDTNQMVTCLKNIDSLDLVGIHKEIFVPLRDWITIFVPTVEIYPDEYSFLPSEPYELISKGIINKVPWISGTNSHEGLFFTAGIFRNETLLEILRNDFEGVASKLLDIPYINHSKQLKQLKQFYIENNDIANHPNMIEIDKYTNIFSDRTFNIPSHTSGKLQCTHAPVYLYYYTYTRDNSLANYILAMKGNYPAMIEIIYHIISSWINKNIFGYQQPKHGVCHADEISMFYPVVWDSDINIDGKDYQISNEIIKLWVSFAYNKPLKIHNILWEPINEKNIKYLKLDKISTIINTPFQNRIDFWNTNLKNI